MTPHRPVDAAKPRDATPTDPSRNLPLLSTIQLDLGPMVMEGRDGLVIIDLMRPRFGNLSFHTKNQHGSDQIDIDV